MSSEAVTNPKPYGGLRFHRRKMFIEALPFILSAECAIVTAERAGFTIKENAERTEALRVRLSDPFLSGVRSLAFDCRLADSRGVQPRDQLGRFLFVARQPAFKGDPAESGFLDRLATIIGAFNKGTMIYLPWTQDDKPRRAMRFKGKSGASISYQLEDIGSVTFDTAIGQVRIEGAELRFVFEVTSVTPVIMPSLVTAYLFRTLRGRQYPGSPSSG